MDNTLTKLLSQNPSFVDGLNAFQRKGKSVIYGLSGSQKSFLLNQAFATGLTKPVVIVVHDKDHKEMWERDLAFFWPNIPVLSFPITDNVEFTTTARSLEDQGAQMRALALLAWQEPAVVIANAEEVTQYVVSPQYLKGQSLHFSLNDTIERDTALEQLVTIGYERVDQVEQRGHFAVRGDILDIYPVNSEHPIRIEFFGDEIDTLRFFSVENQRSIEQIDSYTVTPFFLGKSDADCTLLSYVKDGTLIYDEPGRIQEALKKFLKEDPTHRKNHCDWSELQRTVEATNQVAFTFMQQRSIGLPGFNPIGIQGKTMTSFERQIPLLTDEIKQWHRLNHQVVLVLNNQQRREGIERALEGEGIAFVHSTEWIAKPNTVVILQGLLTDGFELPNSHLVVVVEGNIYGQQKRKLRNKPKKGQEINYFTDLTPGDYVVHSMHGIGKYIGLKTIETEGIHRDYIEIAYAGTDKLFLPANNLDQLQKYIGNEGDVPRIHKMGGRDWAKVVTKAKKSIDDLADKLVEIYAQREITEGFAFLPDQPWQQEFEDAFPYEETEDQLQATAEIKASMEKPVPMDRLLAGDVGFGKTEVAIRAAFKAATDGKQVAILVPTTILAFQHYRSFKERLKDFPVNISYLNRFRTTKQKNETLKGLEGGGIDIVIGTHQLVSDKVKFKDLGLLIIDEEHKFGVSVKDKLKTLRTNIDTLTLTATPIPRTLQFSLMAARDLSVIKTPPPNRQPVDTQLIGFDEDMLRDAISYEIQRDGQVYFINNRIENLQEIAGLIQRLVPDARVITGHGQLDGKELESRILDFMEGKYDVLVSTTIVESGVDVPNANTIFINDAQRFGMADLHQMRGRVGRGNRKAFCYLITPPMDMMTPDARKRLEAVEQFSDLGSGFQIAMKDLEIRGAGDLLGAEQSGFINEMGFDTYQKIMQEALEELQNDEQFEQYFENEEDRKKLFNSKKEVNIDTDLELMLPDDYVQSTEERLLLYQRLAEIETIEELHSFQAQLIDRFGDLPQEAINLLKSVELKWLSADIGLERLIVKKGVFLGYLPQNPQDKFYRSEKFAHILNYLSQNPTSAVLKQKDTPEGTQLIIRKEKVKSIEELNDLLHTVASGARLPADELSRSTAGTL